MVSMAPVTRKAHSTIVNKLSFIISKSYVPQSLLMLMSRLGKLNATSNISAANTNWQIVNIDNNAIKHHSLRIILSLLCYICDQIAN